MNMPPISDLKIYLPLVYLAAAYLAVISVIGFTPALRNVTSGLLKIVNPLVLLGACEYCKRLTAPEFTRWFNGLELALLAYLCVHVIVNLYIARYLVAQRKIVMNSIVRDTIKFFIIALFVVLFLRNILHWNLAAILTPSAILTAIIGLAMQDTIGNFIAGLLIQTEKPFEIGDWIEIEGQQGQVRELNWRYTKIETLDRYYMIVPNSKIATQKVVNYSKPTPLVNEFLSVGVAYDLPPLKVKRAIGAILDSNPNIVKGVNNGVFLHEYADSSIVYKIKYAIHDFACHRQIRDEVLSAVWYQFKKHAIEIPYPIRTVIMQNQATSSQATSLQAISLQAVQPSNDRFINLLSSIPLFSGVSGNCLANFIRFGLIKDVEPQQVIVENNEEGDSMFFILEGECNVVRDGKTVSMLNQGEFFGEMSLLTGEKRNARIEAKTQGTLLEIDRNAFKVLLDSEPALMRQIENIFNQRANANEEADRDNRKSEEIKQTLFGRFKKLFGIV